MRLVAVALLAACSSKADPPPPAPVETPRVDTRPVVGMSEGPVTRPKSDGGKLGAGGFPRGEARVPWTLDGDAIVIDGVKHAFAGGELEVDGMRVRRRGDDVFVQKVTLRRGTLALAGGAMQFVLVGDRGKYGDDYLYVGFDVDRDGAIEVERLDSAELFHVFEKTVSLDGMGYAFEVARDGSRITLTPTGKPLAARPTLAVGSEAPDLAVTTLDGKKATLAGLRGKVVLVDFWSTSCAPCVEALPGLAQMRERLAPRGFEIFGVADEASERADVESKKAAGIEAIDDAAQAVYRIDRFPSYFVVGRDGKIVCAHCALATLEQTISGAL